MQNGLIVDNSSLIHLDNPVELTYQAKMLQAKQKADALYNEDTQLDEELDEDEDHED